jgi:hypothetical protein
MLIMELKVKSDFDIIRHFPSVVIGKPLAADTLNPCFEGKVTAFTLKKDCRAIAQAISRWLPTAAAHVRARVWSCGICGGQSGA